MMYPRLELLCDFLSENGSIWVTIDDNEAHYLKVIMDEIFGRKNFVANVLWQKKFSPQNDAKWFSDMHDHVLVFAKNKTIWKPNRMPEDSKTSRKRKNIDNDTRGNWVSVDYTCNKNKFERPNLYYPITNPNTGEKIWPKDTAVWRFSEDRHIENIKDGFVYWGKTGKNRVPRFKNFKAIQTEGQIPSTLWFHQDVGNTQDARKESLQFNESDPFATPKPERLIYRVFHIATKPGDIVLDSFAGSGTAGAVAHKMGLKWIMLEMGEHCQTHIVPRLKKVCDGTDQGGLSSYVGWKGGGGFRFYRLGVPVFDETGHVSEGIEFAPLAAHIWFIETGVPLAERMNSPFLGSYKGTGYYLLYNGILGDKRPNGGNVLTSKVLDALPPFDGPKVIFGEGCRLSAPRLNHARITFRQIPYEIKAR